MCTDYELLQSPYTLLLQVTSQLAVLSQLLFPDFSESLPPVLKGDGHIDDQDLFAVNGYNNIWVQWAVSHNLVSAVYSNCPYVHQDRPWPANPVGYYSKIAMLLHGVCSYTGHGQGLVLIEAAPPASVPVAIVDGSIEQELVEAGLVDGAPLCKPGKVASRQEAFAGVPLQSDLAAISLKGHWCTSLNLSQEPLQAGLHSGGDGDPNESCSQEQWDPCTMTNYSSSCTS